LFRAFQPVWRRTCGSRFRGPTMQVTTSSGMTVARHGVDRTSRWQELPLQSHWDPEHHCKDSLTEVRVMDDGLYGCRKHVDGKRALTEICLSCWRPSLGDWCLVLSWFRLRVYLFYLFFIYLFAHKSNICINHERKQTLTYFSNTISNAMKCQFTNIKWSLFTIQWSHNK